MTFFIQILKNHGLPFIVLLAVCCVYFYPQIEGKAISQPDSNHSTKTTKESWDYYAKEGKRNLWTNSQFGGMPTFQTGGLENKNIYRYLNKVIRLYIKQPIGAFLFGGISMYILLIILGIGPWVSLIGALTFVFSTQHVILYSVGHNSKLNSLFTFPLVLAGAYIIAQKRYLAGLAMLAFATGLNIYQNHYQMTAYVALFMLALLVVEIIRSFRAGEKDHLVKLVGYSAIALFLAIGPNLTRIITTADYLPSTIRGNAIVNNTEVEGKKKKMDGFDWNFATSFSFNFVDLAGMIVPRFAGGGGKELIPDESALAGEIYRSNYKSKTRKVALYYGNQPFTEGPAYIGIVVFLLFLIAMFNLKHHWKWWALGSIMFAMIYALGSTLGGFHKFLYYNIPMFDRFRAPSSYLSSIIMFFPLLGMWGLHKLMNKKDPAKMLKILYGVGGSLIAFLAIFYAIGPEVIDMTHQSDTKYTSAGVTQEGLLRQREIFFRADVLRALILVILTSGGIWLYLTDKIKYGLMIAVVGVLSVFDVLSVDYRYIYPNRYSQKIKTIRNFEPTPVDLQILKDKDPHYRVFDLSQDPFRTSDVSYFHKSLGGYNAAKLRRYQDFIDYYLKKGSSRAAAMMNARYLIKRDANGEKTVERSPYALGNAWFVDNIRFVKSDQQEIDEIVNIDPARMALVHQEFASQLAGLSPSKNGNVKLTKYSPDELTYTYQSPTENLIVFSEVWYGPDKGWQAYIDNKPVDHLRANYLLRALRVPAGSHSIRFEFDPQSYKIGELLSLIFSILVALVLGYLLYVQIKNAPKPKPVLKAKSKKKMVKKKKKKS